MVYLDLSDILDPDPYLDSEVNIITICNAYFYVHYHTIYIFCITFFYIIYLGKWVFRYVLHGPHPYFPGRVYLGIRGPFTALFLSGWYWNILR